MVRTRAEREIEHHLDKLSLDYARSLDEEEKGKSEEEKKKKEEEDEKRLAWLENQIQEMEAVEILPEAPPDIGEAGIRTRYPDTGEAGAKKRKYPDTGG